MKKACLVLVFSGALLIGARESHASGSVIPRVGRPPVTDAATAQYDLGKSVYNGTAPVANDNASAAAEQKAKLEAWSAKLPASATRAKELPALAGKLSDTQLAALEHFLKTRYGLK